MPALDGAVIAAAGLGSRLGHGLPKCMLDIDGRSILSRLIDVITPFTTQIRVVVGYREDLVIDHCATHHREVILVRNPEFRTTNTRRSFCLGARGLTGKVLYIDGDTVVHPDSFADFAGFGESHSVTLGIGVAKSEDTVYVSSSGPHPDTQVTGFSRTEVQEYEWANLLIGPSDLLTVGDGYVYEALEPLLPLPACRIELAEVDTAQDLDIARQVVDGWQIDGNL